MHRKAGRGKKEGKKNAQENRAQNPRVDEVYGQQRQHPEAAQPVARDEPLPGDEARQGNGADGERGDDDGAVPRVMAAALLEGVDERDDAQQRERHAGVIDKGEAAQRVLAQQRLAVGREHQDNGEENGETGGEAGGKGKGGLVWSVKKSFSNVDNLSRFRYEASR